MTHSIITADVLNWAADYDGEPFHALFCDAPSRHIEALPRGAVLVLTRHDRPVAQVRRLPALRAGQAAVRR